MDYFGLVLILVCLYLAAGSLVACGEVLVTLNGSRWSLKLADLEGSEIVFTLGMVIVFWPLWIAFRVLHRGWSRHGD